AGIGMAVKEELASLRIQLIAWVRKRQYYWMRLGSSRTRRLSDARVVPLAGANADAAQVHNDLEVAIRLFSRIIRDVAQDVLSRPLAGNIRHCAVHLGVDCRLVQARADGQRIISIVRGMRKVAVGVLVDIAQRIYYPSSGLNGEAHKIL